jgi:hypothetical protein
MGGGMRIRGLALAAFFLTACLGSYQPSPSGQGVGSGSSSSGAPAQSAGSGSNAAPDPPPSSPPSTPPSTPPPPSNPPPSNPPPAASPDLGAPPQTGSTACNQLALCCDQLDPTDAANCNAAVAQAKDGVCQAILAAVEANGVTCN